MNERSSSCSSLINLTNFIVQFEKIQKNIKTRKYLGILKSIISFLGSLLDSTSFFIEIYNEERKNK